MTASIGYSSNRTQIVTCENMSFISVTFKNHARNDDQERLAEYKMLKCEDQNNF